MFLNKCRMCNGLNAELDLVRAERNKIYDLLFVYGWTLIGIQLARIADGMAANESERDENAEQARLREGMEQAYSAEREGWERFANGE